MSVALPSELDFSLPSSLPDNKSYEIRTQPTNGATFNTPGSVIQMSLPLLQRSFYESSTMYLTGRIACSAAVPASTAANRILCNPAGIYGAFSRMTVRSANGNTLDDIQNPGQIANVLLKAGLTFSERTSCANTMLLNDRNDNTNLGLQFNIASSPGQLLTLDFCMPMIGLLNMTKYLPAYGTELIIELTLNSLLGFAPVADSSNNLLTGFSFTNLELVSQVLEFSPSAFAMIQQQYSEKIVLKSETYSFGSTNIAGQTVGVVDVPFNIRVNSLKRLFLICSPSDVLEGVGFGSVNPNANSISFVSNGFTYPQRPVQCARPAEVYAQFQKAFGGLYSSEKTGSIPIVGFRRASTAYVTNVYGAYTPAPAATATDKYTTANTSPNSWYFVLDLEALSAHKDTMYNGINTTGSSANYIRIDIGTALANVSHTVSYFSCHDVLLNIDLVNGIVSTIV